ncbi:hypothetical protein ARMGADRAFT_729281 [Armillaria gallica]|uniref:Uncharacterized protein n=1 Tax=Armillaria gallica TaxID=47427 RepID=A0A2H3D0V4_ARMGA|nr:hypothetical protein ARMGADRAFT_729281 [Armillaria gallica]
MSILMVHLTKSPSLSTIPRTSVYQHPMGVVASPTASSEACEATVDYLLSERLARAWIVLCCLENRHSRSEDERNASLCFITPASSLLQGQRSMYSRTC